jgi:uncharacterized protein
MIYKKSNYLYFLKIKEKYYIIQTLLKEIFEVDFDLYNFLKNKNLFFREDFKKLMSSKICQNLIKNKILLPTKLNEVETLYKIYKNKENLNSFESLHIIPTLRCTLNCRYCFVLKNAQISKENLDMDFLTARKGINFFFKKNIHPNPLITFYGGEPLIRFDLIVKCVEYIEKKLKKKIRKKIITNATLVNEEIAQKLKKYKFDVSVSIDGNENAHNANRINWQGKGSFKDTIRGYKLLQKAGINVKILCTVGSHNIKNLEENTEFLLDLKPTAIALNLPKKIEGSDLEKGFTPEFLMRKYLNALKICYKRKIPELHFADLIYGFLRKGVKYRPCSGCGSQISVTPEGLIGPCQAYAVTKKYFIKMPKTKKELYQNKIFTKWRNVNCFTSKGCAYCPIMPICYGDCPFDRENRSGSLLIPSPPHCYSRRIMFEYLIKRVISNQSLFFKPFS